MYLVPQNASKVAKVETRTLYKGEYHIMTEAIFLGWKLELVERDEAGVANFLDLSICCLVGFGLFSSRPGVIINVLSAGCTAPAPQTCKPQRHLAKTRGLSSPRGEASEAIFCLRKPICSCLLLHTRACLGLRPPCRACDRHYAAPSEAKRRPTAAVLSVAST